MKVLKLCYLYVFIDIYSLIMTKKIYAFKYLRRMFLINPLRGCSYGGELARLSELARLGKMIFIPRPYGIFCLSSIKKFVMSLKKDYLIKYFLQ